MATTITEEMHGSVKLVRWDWQANASGDVDSTTTGYYSGKLLYVTTSPGSGATIPSDNYDVTLLDKNAIDLLDSAGYNRDAASTETILCGSLGTVANSQLRLVVDAAGSTTTGTAFVWLR